MAGTKEGAQKARNRNLQNDPNYYSKIGKRSWVNPRSHETGFAKLSREKHIELSAKGGKKTKSDYKTTVSTTEEVEYLTYEEFKEIFKDTDTDGTDVSE